MRRPSAGAVPGRWGACLAVRTPPAAFIQLVRADDRVGVFGFHARARACHGVGPESDERRAIKQTLRCVVSGEHQFNALSQIGVLSAGLLEPGGSLCLRDGTKIPLSASVTRLASFGRC